MTRQRLTKQELTWLLALEARGAAEALRHGISEVPERTTDVPPVEMTLDTLDDTIQMLSELQSDPPARGRRGRIDLAALLYELAPTARIEIEPGAGTEVSGEEAELLRMLHVLVSQTTSDPTSAQNASPDVHVRREGDWVRVSVELGPDSSATSDLESRWLHRMAVRHGGRLELEGGTQSMLLPAVGPADGREVLQLRRELAQAQELGEAYAKELAEVANSTPSDAAASHGPQDAQHLLYRQLINLARATHPIVSEATQRLVHNVDRVSQLLSPQPQLLEELRRDSAAFASLASALHRIAMVRANESASRIDVLSCIQGQIRSVAADAVRRNQHVQVNSPSGLGVSAPAETFKLIVWGLLTHALEASPEGTHVDLYARKAEGHLLLEITDGGPPIPLHHLEKAINHEVDPESLGRPVSVALLVASTCLQRLGGTLSVEDSGGKARTRAEVPLDG